MTIDIDDMTEDSWPDRLKDELNDFRKNLPKDKVTEHYLDTIEENFHKIGEEIVKLRQKVRELEKKKK